MQGPQRRFSKVAMAASDVITIVRASVTRVTFPPLRATPQSKTPSAAI